MSAPIRTLSGICEISTGTLSINGMPPVYQGDNSVEVSVSLTDAGEPYNVPDDVNASMHLYYMHNQTMTESQPMQKSGSTISGIIPDVLTALGGTPLLVIRLIDADGRIITTCSVRITIIRTLGSAVVATIPPTPDEIVYVGRAPYIGENGHWFQWDNTQAIYVDSQIEAQGPVGPAGGVNSVNGKTGEVSLSAEDVGAMPVTGGAFSGDISAPSAEFTTPLNIDSGGTGANNAAGARNNLSVPELRSGVVIVGNQKGIGTSVSAGQYWQLWNLQSGSTYPAGLVPSENGTQYLGQNGHRIKAVYANDYPCGTWNGNAIAVAKGGTGASDAAGARANLGITPANIGALSKSGDTATGNIIVGTDTNDAFIGFIAKRVASDNGAVYKTQMACGATGSGKVSFMNAAGTVLNEMELGKTQTTFTKPVALSSGGLGRSFASEAALKTYLQGLLGLS